MEITPFIPLTLRGRFKERVLTLRGMTEVSFQFPCLPRATLLTTDY